MSVYAETARFSLGQLPPTEAIYFTATHDAQNRSLDAGSNYMISLPLPLPVKAFWSLTMYNATSLLFVNNPINRYNVGDHVSVLLPCMLNLSTHMHVAG